MPDDPREILNAAGVECAEVDFYASHPADYLWKHTRYMKKESADAAILALAQIVAKYKWQLGRVLADEVGVFEGGTDEWGNVVPDDSRELADLDRRWEEHCR